MSILSDIIDYKKLEVDQAQKEVSLSELEKLASNAPATRPFAAKLSQKCENGFGLIAEVKKASPSKGLIRPNFRPSEIAQSYEEGGAACLSVLTDFPSFQGKPEYLIAARKATTLPVLRKDFMVRPYQIVQSRAMGADCILLIAACLSDLQLNELTSCAKEWHMDVLVEVHDESELERALQVDSKLIGVNNRNLKTFETDLSTSIRLSKLCPNDIELVSESGLRNHQDLQRMSASGINRFLIGESLMRQDGVRAATQALLQGN